MVTLQVTTAKPARCRTSRAHATHSFDAGGYRCKIAARRSARCGSSMPSPVFLTSRYPLRDVLPNARSFLDDQSRVPRRKVAPYLHPSALFLQLADCPGGVISPTAVYGLHQLLLGERGQ